MKANENLNINSSMIIYIVCCYMSQPKLQLVLPTHLTLHHFFTPVKLLSTTQQESDKKIACSRVAARLKAMVPDDDVYYGRNFVLNFLLIKLNSLLSYSTLPSALFVPHFLQFYNRLMEDATCQFKYSRNDGELMAQLLLESGAHEWITQKQLDELLEGSALIGATAIQAIREGEKLTHQCYFVVVLGLISLHGRTNPYIPIVHQEKNHIGQIQFAKRIDELIHLNSNIEKVNLEIIQDAYSLRCSPQVHGVSIDCLLNLKASLEGLVNRPQTRHISIKGKRIRNLSLRAQSETQLLDQFILSLNEIGHMSFLRAQRILNKHLGKNNISKSEHFEYLRTQLKKCSYLVGENKLLATPSSADTILMQEYRHDIYVNEGTAQRRFTTITANIRRILKVESMAALEVIFDMYAKEGSLFLNKEMQEVYLYLVGLREEDSMKFGAGIEEWLNR